MKKLIATLILGLGLSGAALADEGYFADHVGDFSNVPVQVSPPFDGRELRAYHESPEPVAVRGESSLAAPLVVDWAEEGFIPGA